MNYRVTFNGMLAAAVALAAGCIAGPASADHGGSEFGTLHVFGDSSTDDGNFFAEFGVYMHPTFALFYPTGSFSNGPVWSRYLVNLGVAFEQDNRAYAGAMSGAYGEPARMGFETGLLPTGLRTQIDKFQSDILAGNVSLGSDDAVGIWVAFNDYLFGSAFGVDNAPATVVGNIAEAVARLDALGARHILVFNLPNLAQVPLASRIDPAAARQLGTASAIHNALLAGAMARLDLQLQAEVVLVDVYAAMSQIIGLPERFGFTNATDSCIVVLEDGVTSIPDPFSPCVDNNGTPQNPFDDIIDPTGFVFWDLLHPTTATHELLAEFVAATLEARGFGMARRGSAVDETSVGGVVFVCPDTTDGFWCH